MRALLKIAGVYCVATLPFAWQFQSSGSDVLYALLWGLRAPFDVVMQLVQGVVTVGMVPLGLFVFILFIGLTGVWASESQRS